VPNASYKWRVLAVVVIGVFMVLLNTTVVNVALPSIMNAFGASLDRAQLVVSMYLVALGLVIPLTGYLGDRLGTKRLFTITVAGFTLGSALTGLAWDINSLIFFRTLQGLAGGITMPLGMALIFRTVPREEQGFLMSLAAIPMLLGPMLGPVMSGYLVDTVGWRWVFFINVPVGTLGVVLATRLLQETEKIATLPFDYKGFVLAGIGFAAPLLALSRVSQEGWTGASVVGLFMLSGVALVAWVFVELREKSPLLDLRIFRTAAYSHAVSIYCIGATIQLVGLFLMPLFLQNVRLLSPTRTGILVMPEALASVLVLPVVGRIFDKFGPRPLIIPGVFGMTYAMFKLHGLDVTTSDADLVKIFVLRGVSFELMLLPAFTTTMSVFGPAQVARASAVTQVMRQLFPAFGAAVFATMFQSRHLFHINTLAQTVTPDSLAVVQILSRLKQAAGQFGASGALTNQTAIGVLDGLVQSRAAVSAFNDMFLIGAILTLVVLVPGIFLSRLKRPAAQPAVVAAAPETAD
jgi:EmrB/QacA subfamily drug resistance transporter